MGSLNGIARIASVFLRRPAGPPSRNLFPIAFSRNGLCDIEKRDCCGFSERPVSGCRADLTNGRHMGRQPTSSSAAERPTINRSMARFACPTSAVRSGRQVAVFIGQLDSERPALVKVKRLPLQRTFPVAERRTGGVCGEEGGGDHGMTIRLPIADGMADRRPSACPMIAPDSRCAGKAGYDGVRLLRGSRAERSVQCRR